MLVLAPKRDEVIVIEVPNDDPTKEPKRIEVSLLTTNNRIRIGIEADRDVSIYRDKLTEVNT